MASVGAGHLDLVYAAAWFPWLLWAAYQFAHERQAAHGWLAVFAALCFLADVRLSAYAFATTAAYLLWLIIQRPESRRSAVVLRALWAGLLTLGLTAFQWVPLLLYRADLSRSEITLDDAAIDSLKAGQWLGLLIGEHGGAWETLVYVGISTLILAIVALLLRPRQFVFWGIVLLLLMSYAMGDQFILWPLLNRLLPFLRWWRVPPRVWLIAALILPYLAGWGAQLLVEHPPDRKIARLSTVALLGGGMVCGLFSTLTLNSAIDLSPLLGLFFLPATALIMLLVIVSRVPPRIGLALFALVVVADVLWMDHTVIEGRAKSEWLEPHRELAEYLRADGAVRVYSPSYSLPQHAAAYWQIPQFGGVDPFQLADYVAAAEEATGVHASSYSVTLPAFEVTDDIEIESPEDIFTLANQDAAIQPDLLAQWLVTHVVSAFEIDAPGLELDAQIGDVYVYRNTLAPDVALAWDGPNRVTIAANAAVSGPLYAVANGRWQNALDDTPGLPGTVEPNTQQWTYTYDYAEIWFSGIASVGLLGLALILRGRVSRA